MLPLVLLACIKATLAMVRFALGMPQRGSIAGLRAVLGWLGLAVAYAIALGLGVLVAWAAPFPLALVYHGSALLAGLIAAADAPGTVLRGLLWWPLMPFCWGRS